ncbi:MULTISPECIES: DUF5085 family protein [Enterococcus]|uniref:Bacterial transcription activator effector binding domain-containing protein n=1 Tax=Enterococcus malodoratus ATCC 43197 TaxID=1158601 RepID=R2QWK0_9ENTE|nr:MULTISPECIES: DUF5085 family protein [Enterococcus]EOH72836.1 hypothetical protein UAI_03720 [Enterococcus malodoratus ATCC 43197]EOT67384.1 hypothetical protein I585_02905 [Enterococcus malodoratus ATCC 43197]SPX03158.1 Uncharacterised protein [Enterococcus malodoratus]STD69364.1 Uncharacterised protein [Enterococcus malodoratus]HCM84744.1 DUF5085 domain-containing protein [Enterococcus sp.]
MKRTIGYNQTLQFEHVISRYYITNSEETGQCFEDAMKTIFDAGYSLAENFFYSTNSDIRDEEELLIQVFLPVNEQNQDNLPEDYRFQTYFQVNNLLATRVKGDSSNGFSEALGDLLGYVVETELEVTSPIFYCPEVVNEVVYTDLMIGVKPTSE